MKTSPSPSPDARRRGERGAALITVLLLSTLLLAAGGALILTSGMAATTAVDATAEMQAYYAAESGLESALAVLRRNVAPKVAGTSASNFRTVVCGTNATCVNNGRDFSDWLTYTSGAITLGNNLSYTLTVRDASVAAGATLPAAPYTPRHLLVESVGRDSKGTVRRMRMLIDRNSFEFTPRSTLLMRGDEDCSNMADFSIGQSNAKEYSGNDSAVPAQAPLPVFGTTCAGNNIQATATVAGSKPNTVTDSPQGKVAQITNSDLPPWLRSANDARSLLLDLAARAESSGRYFTETPDDFGTSGSPQFTFVDGDCDLRNGAGLLVVTGRLSMSGNANFNGVILVLGEGEMTRNGGGNGDILGAIVVAKFDRTWPAEDNDEEHPFLAPSFQTNGGGNSTVQYNSTSVNDAMSTMGSRILGVHEY